MGTSAADMQRLFGRAILFIFRTQNWTVGQFAEAARFARSLGFDTISPKRAEGTDRWYGTPANLRAERAAVLAEGCGYAPFVYCDGPRFGLDFIPRECNVLKEVGEAMSENGSPAFVIADMETEWNGNTEAASVFEQQMRPWNGILGVTTWADPAEQAWLGVMAAIAPAVNVWIPQRYDNWLAAQGLPAEATIIQPAVDLSTEFGANNALRIVQGAARQNQSVWVWEYVYAQQDPSLARQITAALHAETGAAHIQEGIAGGIPGTNEQSSTPVSPALEAPEVAPAASQAVAAPAAAASAPAIPLVSIYTVSSSDLPGGLLGIAGQFGLSLYSLIAANPDIDPTIIYSNMRLNIPAV